MLECLVDPLVFEGDYALAAAGISPGGGYGGAAIILGGAWSIGSGPIGGIALQGGFVIGKSWVFDSKVWDCCEN